MRTSLISVPWSRTSIRPKTQLFRKAIRKIIHRSLLHRNNPVLSKINCYFEDWISNTFALSSYTVTDSNAHKNKKLFNLDVG